MAKINILMAMSEYEDEQARLAEEMAETTQTAKAENDPLWNCWYHLAFYYEPKTNKVFEDADEATCTDEGSQPVYTSLKKDRAKRAMRRKATAMHNRKVRRNVAIIWQNYGERETVDMYNWSYKKLKNGERILRPKSQTAKADYIFKKAMKSGRVPKELKAELTEHLEWVSKYGKRNIAGQLNADQFARGREEAVKRELDEMAAEGVNIFNALEMNSYCKRILRQAA